jgi:hypothetical protein
MNDLLGLNPIPKIQLPLEIINKILCYRPRHPLANAIKPFIDDYENGRCEHTINSENLTTIVKMRIYKKDDSIIKRYLYYDETFKTDYFFYLWLLKSYQKNV